MSGRQRLRALAGGHGVGGLAVPLALPTAARIQERDWEDFLEDPTQLANGLRDLHQALGAHGLAVSSAEVLLEESRGGLGQGPHALAVVEAVRRLRASLGDLVALIVPIPGPISWSDRGIDPAAAVDQVTAYGKDLLAAGADVLLVVDDRPAHPSLSTLGNIARFHQGALAVTNSSSPGQALLAEIHPLETPRACGGLAVSPVVPRDTDITVLEDWIDAVQG